MPNKYDKEIEEDTKLRDILILERITSIYEDIRKKAQEQSKSVIDKAGKDQAYFNQGTRLSDFETEFSHAVRPDYVKRDAFSKKIYAEEYNTAYMQAKYAVENQGISKGYKFKLPNYKDKQFKEARDYALSKLMSKSKMTTGRNLNVAQLEDIIVSGVQQGQSLTKINKNLDIKMGFRDTNGKWVKDVSKRKGQQYETQRILRTEISRIRKSADTDQWINQQDIVESKLQLVETLDDRTRQQSISMDGNYANKEGKFLFPSDWHYAGQSGVAKYDINDRSTTINIDPEYKPSQRIARDKDGKNKIIPYQNAETWAKANGLQRNKYGELLYGKKPIKTVKPKVIKPKAVKPSIKTPSAKEIKYDFGRVDKELASIWKKEINTQIKEYPKLDIGFVGSTQSRNKAMKAFYKPEMEKLASKYHKIGTEGHRKLTNKFLNAKVGRTGSSVMGQSMSKGEFKGITLNEKFAMKSGRYIREIQQNIDAGWFVNVDPTKKTLLHELGHQMDHLVDARKNKNILNIYKTKDIKTGLSGYGNTSIEEMIAESWAEYKLASNPRTIAKEIGEIIENEYSRRYR